MLKLIPTKMHATHNNTSGQLFESICLLFQPQWFISSSATSHACHPPLAVSSGLRIKNFYKNFISMRLLLNVRSTTLLGWLSLGRYSSYFIFPLAWWHEPRTLLQEFTSLPVVIPGQNPWYTDVSFMVLLKQNSLAPSFAHSKKSNRISNNCRREEKPAWKKKKRKTGGWAQKGMPGRQREPSVIGA